MKSIYLKKMVLPATAGLLLCGMPLGHAAPDAGAALAETCATCHGTDTNGREGFENLRGENVYGDLIEMKRRTIPRNIMDLVARTYTDPQLRDVSQYLQDHPDVIR